MLRKLMWITATVAALCMLVGCTGSKILHCDHCGKEVTVEQSSNMEEDWIIYCPECNEELFADDPIVGKG